MDNVTEKVLGAFNIGGLVTGAVMLPEIGNIIYLILGIISLIVSIICGSLKIYFTIKKAKADGVITEKEIDEIINTVDDVKKDVKENLKNKED